MEGTTKPRAEVAVRQAITVSVLLGCAGCAGAGAPAGHAEPPARFASVPDQFLTTPGARIRYRDYSRGTAVILLHGYTDRLETMEPIADSLAPGHRIIALDARGFGESTRYSDPARYGPAMLDDVLRLMDARGVRRAHVIGYSMGALMAAHLAAHHPGRVLSVTLLGVPWFPDTASAQAFVGPWVAMMRRGDDGFGAFMQWMFPAWGDSLRKAICDSVAAVNDRGAMLASLEGLVALTVHQPGRLGGVPALAIAGQDDPLLPNSVALVDAWPGAQLLTLPGADHATVLTRPSYMDAVRVHLGTPVTLRPGRFVREGRRDASPNS